MAVDPQLFKTIAADDPDIADAYAAIMKSRNEIDEMAIDILLAVAAKDSKITGKEAAALSTVIYARLMTSGALERLQALLVDPNGIAAFIAGGRPMNDKEMGFVFQALASAQTVVNFQSPGTRLEYNAAAYDLVIQLVKNKNITITAMRDRKIYANIAGINGIYIPGSNTLALVGGAAGENDIVHELTHAFQDFMDVIAKTNDIEADAHIAEGLFISKKDPPQFAAATDNFTKAAKFILDNPGAAKLGNKKWEKVYEDASKAYEPMRLRSRRPIMQDWSANESVNEKKILQALMSKAAQPAAGSGAKPAQPAAGSGAKP